MPIGRPSGRIVRELSWQSRAVSTAACMAALVAPAPVGVGRAADNRGP
jgi:hypothetical protein